MGPTSAILLSHQLTQTEIESFQATIESISSEIRKNAGNNWDFWVNTTRPLNGSYAGEGRPFSVETQDAALEEHEAVTLLVDFNFEPQQLIQIDAMCNNSEDHLILGELTLRFTEMHGGLVDFGGALLPRLPEEMYKDLWLWQEAHWWDVERYFKDMTGNLPGKVVSVTYPTISGRIWAKHVADVEFMRAWLQHPRFHMIK